jgi:CubicO group peptidase (beta-lactamase class C family)
VDGLERIDGVADAFVADERAPGLVYAVVSEGAVVHARGIGARRIGVDAPPDAETVFRIASMTKSFTAAAVLSLRDEGRLRLDDPAAAHVPEVAETEPLASLTIRQLLTMSGGLPNDDPWGDRQQDLPLERFTALLREGATFAWRPGTMFEYSNLGYGILGRVVTNVAGVEYRDVVRTRLLEPLGMRSTVFEAAEVDAGRVAIGYASRDEAFVEEPFAAYGALASMGGLFSTVSDLAAWVDGFARAFDERGHDDGHPVSRGSRLEMQQGARMIPPMLDWDPLTGPPTALVVGYGMGLFVRWSLEQGLTISHSGGYPGFGSHMRWHPASGFGVVVLANRTYYPASTLGEKLLSELLRSGRVARRPLGRTTALERAREDVERLLASWDDALAERIFTMNVALDDPLEHRRAAIERLRETHGELRRSDEEPIGWSPLACEWWLEGERGGRVKVEVALSPEREPRVQWFDVTSVAAPSPQQVAAAQAVVELANGGDVDPALAPALDRGTLERVATVVRTVFGPVALGPVIAGEDRERTFRVDGERGALELTIRLDGDGRLETATWKMRTVEAPTFDVR